MFVPNPFTDYSTKDLKDLDYTIYSTIDGETGVVRVGDSKTYPLLKIGGRSDVLESSASVEIDSTIQKTAKREGMITNPLVSYPSSMFTPIPPMINAIFAGPLSIVSNAPLVAGLIAVVATIRTDESSYTTYYNKTDTLVVDNELLEERLFQ